MSKQRKKIRCICKGRKDRIHYGADRQKHIQECPMNLKNRR